MKTRFLFPVILLFLFALTSAGQRSTFPLNHAGQPGNQTDLASSHDYLSPQLDRLLDSVYNYEWVSSDWSLKLKNFKLYNSNGWITEDKYVIKTQTNTWSNYGRFLYFYNDPSPDVAFIRGQLWTAASSWLDYQYTHFKKKDVIDTTFTKDWNPVKQKFVSGTREIFTYDDQDSVTNELTQRYDTTSSNWINLYQNIINYTTSHMISEEIFTTWNNEDSVWVNINRRTNDYDASGFLITHAEFIWNDTASNWENSSKTTFTKDLSGNPDTSKTEIWDNTQLAWMPYGQSIFFYNILGWRLSEREQLFNPLSSVFEDYYLTYYTYFTSGVLNEITGNFWKPVTTEWVTDYYYKVDSNLLLVEDFHKYYNQATFEITGGNRTMYTYSGKLQLTNVLNQDWEIVTKGWVDNSQTNYIYNENKLLEEMVDQNWEEESSSWVNVEKSRYFYSEPYGINDFTKDETLCYFSNPLKRGTQINCAGFAPGQKHLLQVYSLSGALVYQQEFTGGNPFSISADLKPGQYLFLFSSENGKQKSIRKILVL